MLIEMMVGEVRDVGAYYYPDREEGYVLIENRVEIEEIHTDSFVQLPERGDVVFYAYYNDKVYWVRAG